MVDRELVATIVHDCRLNRYQRTIEHRKIEERRREAYRVFIRSRIQRCLNVMRLNMGTSNV